MKRPGGKERAGGPERRIQNRQKIPCMLPMNRVEDIHIPCTVERMKKGPPRSRSLWVQKIMRARCRTRRPLSPKSIAWRSKAWGGGWAEKVRWSPARKMMCRLLARMTSQRRSVPCAELAAVRAGSARCDGGPMATRPEALQVVDAGAARMFSSLKHTPLRVRVRPGGACEAHGTASRCSRRAWRVCGQVPELFHGSNARRGARPS